MEEKIFGTIFVDIDKEYSTHEIAKKMKSIDGVRDLYDIAGKHDIMANLYSSDIYSMNLSVDKIREVNGVTDTETYIILKDHNSNK